MAARALPCPSAAARVTPPALAHRTVSPARSTHAAPAATTLEHGTGTSYALPQQPLPPIRCALRLRSANRHLKIASAPRASLPAHPGVGALNCHSMLICSHIQGGASPDSPAHMGSSLSSKARIMVDPSRAGEFEMYTPAAFIAANCGGGDADTWHTRAPADRRQNSKEW
jgi:hypothetical protein